jgi:hypothetical protein
MQCSAWHGNPRHGFFKGQVDMKHIDVVITGESPLICNNFYDEAAIAATEGTRPAAVGHRGTPRQQAEKRLYKGIDGRLIIPQPNVYRNIIDGGQFFKVGKSKVTTTKSSMIPSLLEVYGHENPAEIPIISKEGWRVDTRAVRIPGGGRILIHRPMFDDWRLEFGIGLDLDIMTEEFLRQIFDAAGRRVGLGDFRPGCKGPFGRWVVAHWEECSDEGDQKDLKAVA